MVSQFPLSSDFVLLRDAMNQLLSDSFVPSGGSRSGWGSGSQAMARPVPLDVYATPDEAVVIAAVPGMSPEQLEITYTQNTLTLSGSIGRMPNSPPSGCLMVGRGDEGLPYLWPGRSMSTRSASSTRSIAPDPGRTVAP